MEENLIAIFLNEKAKCFLVTVPLYVAGVKPWTFGQAFATGRTVVRGLDLKP